MKQLAEEKKSGIPLTKKQLPSVDIAGSNSSSSPRGKSPTSSPRGKETPE